MPAKTTRLLGAMASMTMLLAGCSRPATPETAAENAGDAPKKGFVIAHTNDLHAHFRPQAIDGFEQPVGGMVALSGAMEQLRDQWGDDRVLVLDGGDVRSGTPLDEYVVDGVHTGAMLLFMDAMGYDAWAVGNHEFDRGLEDAGLFISTSRVPALSANLENAEGAPLFPELERVKIFEMDGTSVGVVGATTPGLKRFVAGDMSAMNIVDPAEAVRKVVDAHPEVEVWVALTHLGVDDDRTLALGVPELDLIVGGHSHTRLEEAVQVGDTWIVQAGCYMQGLGVSAVSPRGDGTIDFSYELTAPLASQFEALARREVRALASEWTDRLQSDWGVVVGEAQVSLGRTYDEESEMGRWVTWALTKRTGADVAIYNSGGLRSDIEAGPLTRESLYNAFPFGNEVVIAEVPGSALIALALRNSTAMLDPESASIVQQHGLAYTYGTRLGSAELQEVTVGGQPVDPDRTYRVATNSFVMGQAERYLGMKPAVVTGTEESVRDALAAVLQETGPIESAPPVGGTRAP